MQFTCQNGIVQGARQLASPNHDKRPENTEVELVVVHGISLPPADGSTKYIDDFFCNKLDHDAHAYFDCIRDLKVSSHLLIAPDGAVTQYVNLNDRAWHAGSSSFQGREKCNDFAVGIELIGQDHQPYTWAQYQS